MTHFGFKQPLEMIEKRVRSRAGYKHTTETKIKIGNANRGKSRLTGNQSPRWKGGENKCLDCGKQLRGYRSMYCAAHARIGDRSHLWRGGVVFRKKKNERNDSAYNAWVRQVKKRDEGICRLQNENCMGYKVVHHILKWSEYPEERYNINNGITLCQYHHPRKHIDEQRLIPVLQMLVGSNKIIL